MTKKLSQQLVFPSKDIKTMKLYIMESDTGKNYAIIQRPAVNQECKGKRLATMLI